MKKLDCTHTYSQTLLANLRETGYLRCTEEKGELNSRGSNITWHIWRKMKMENWEKGELKIAKEMKWQKGKLGKSEIGKNGKWSEGKLGKRKIRENGYIEKETTS